MITIKNPTQSTLSIVFRGQEFTIEAGASLVVRPEVAAFWKGIHGFIETSKSTKEESPVEEESVESVESVEPAEESVEEVEAEEVEEKKTAKKKKIS